MIFEFQKMSEVETRDFIAIQAMTGILSNHFTMEELDRAVKGYRDIETGKRTLNKHDLVCSLAYKYADYLILESRKENI